MSDFPEDLDLSMLGQHGSPATATAARPLEVSGSGAPVHSVSPGETITAPAAYAPMPSPIMVSPGVPYPVAAPAHPGDPLPTINHYPWTPLPLTPVEPTPQPIIVETVTTSPAPAPAPPPIPPPLPPKPVVQALIPAAPVLAAPAVTAAVPPPAMIRPPELPQENVAHIYSDYTQEVWHVFRPSIGFGLFVLVSVGMVVLVGVFLLQNSGMEIYEVPFIKEALGLN